MKIKQLLVLLAFTAINLCAMEPEYKPSAIELLPEEAKVHIFDYLDYAPTIEQAIQNIQNTARVNQNFSRLLSDQPLTKKFIDRLVAKFPEQTQKDRMLAALYLNTAGSRIWLDKNHPEWNHPEWKEFAKNLAKKILDRLIAEPNDAPILSALLNVPGIADYIKNYKDDMCRTALMMAASGDHTTIVEKLLSAGTQPNIKDEGGWATYYAAGMGHTTIVEKLLAKGADPNITNFWGRTALMRAASGGHTTIVEKLLAAGAQPNMKDEYGDTALDYAHGHVAVIKLLEEHMKKAIS